jgi:glycosyltransferase involved in cell wall biosynthesis
LRSWGLVSDKYILFVSRLTPENRAETLIEAFARSESQYKLVIVGDSRYVDDYREKIFKMCEQTENVVWLGYRFSEDYQILSSNCRYFVLPSGVDGTRPVLLDQMGFGNCVVVCDTPANMEVIGSAGLSFSRDDQVESLIKVIRRLEFDSLLLEDLRAKAWQRVGAHYSWESITNSYVDLFQNMYRNGFADGEGGL